MRRNSTALAPKNLPPRARPGAGAIWSPWRALPRANTGALRRAWRKRGRCSRCRYGWKDFVSRCTGATSFKLVPPPSLQLHLDFLLHAWAEMILHDHARAGIPVQQRIIIARRADFFGLFKARH